MKARLLIGLALSSAALLAQSEDCREAFSEKNAVAEELASVKPNLRALWDRLNRQSQRCGILSGLWRLRETIAEKLGNKADAAYSHQRGMDRSNLSDREFEALLATEDHKTFDPSHPARNSWALIAGTGVFRNRSIRGLEFVGRDLGKMKSLLAGGFGFDAKHILDAATGEHFTRDEYRKQFSALRDQVGEDDLVVVYLSSHGYEGPDDANNSSILLAYDSDISSSERRFQTGIQVIGLVQEVFRELKARRIVLMLDFCFSGDAITGQRNLGGQPSPKFLEFLTQDSGRVVIAAASADQRSWELPGVKQGAFVQCFAEASEGRAGATIGEIFSGMKGCVTEKVRELPGKPVQEPLMFAGDAARRITLKR